MFFRSTGNERVDHALQLLMETSSDKQMSVNKYVGNKIKKINIHMHEKPWIYIATAALSGLAISLLWRRS